MKTYRAVLAVDHYDLLADARAVIGQHRNLILSGEAAIGIELLTLLNSVPVDVAIFSLAAPSHRKREVIRIVANRYPHLKLFFIHHRIPTPLAIGVFGPSLRNTVCGGISRPIRDIQHHGIAIQSVSQAMGVSNYRTFTGCFLIFPNERN